MKEWPENNQPANFEDHWHLRISKPLEESAIQPIKQKLLQHRCSRVYPHRDEKILTAWNGLMIKGMTLAGLALRQENLIDSAEQALIFIQKNLFQN